MNDQNNPIRLFAWQPKGHGEFSFFVAATSEEDAKKAVENYISKHCSREFDASGFGTNYYELTVLNAGEVIANENN